MMLSNKTLAFGEKLAALTLGFAVVYLIIIRRSFIRRAAGSFRGERRGGDKALQLYQCGAGGWASGSV